MGDWIIVFGDEGVSYGSYQIGPFESKRAAEAVGEELYSYAKEKDDKEEFSYLAMALNESELDVYELSTVAEVIANDAENEDPTEVSPIVALPPPSDDRPEAAKALDMHMYNDVKSPEYGRDWMGSITAMEPKRVQVRYTPTWNAWTDPRGRVEAQGIWYPYAAFSPIEPTSQGIRSFLVSLTDALGLAH